MTTSRTALEGEGPSPSPACPPPVPAEAVLPSPPAPVHRRPWVRRLGKLALDLALAALAWHLAVGLGPEGGDRFVDLGAFLALAVGIDLAFGLTAQHYRLLELSDARAILLAGAALAVLSAGWCALWKGAQDLPGLDDHAIAGGLCGLLWLVTRILFRSLASARHPHTAQVPERALIVGAGRAGLRLCQDVEEHPRLGLHVVGFVDDDPEKQGVRIQGVPVLGPTDRLDELVRAWKADLVIFGMAGGVPRPRLKELQGRAQALGVQVRMAPGIRERIGEAPWRPEYRAVPVERLLHRAPVTLEGAGLGASLEGRAVLITGAGGSIGAEMARRVAACRPARLLLLGRGENSLWEIEGDLARGFPGLPVEVVLCDVRDPVRVGQAFQAWRPEVVLHAAAHKHVPYLERYPEEAVRNNIFGTRNVARAALAAGTRAFVNVSTDKAVNPVSALGASKRIGELLVLGAARRAPEGSRFVSVRFGNVLGSRGSVIPRFEDQIARGGPLTVTDPAMFRYFMTIPEAVQLALQAGLLGAAGRVYTLDMGEPVSILDLARDLARMSGLTAGVDIEVAFTGARPGEKLVEELFTEAGAHRVGLHPKIFETPAEDVDPAALEAGLLALEAALELPEGARQRRVAELFHQLVPSYRPSPVGLGRFLDGRG
ncbi:polysaccharide biosynthesis protein [Mesoterricola sediminis]|uniref:Polysaccharide biosynthesis protein CapD n=1 Tax=Mesoterricola sediminis TaxID=2927980 RepID=A0AA48GWM3_9BACT|nr:nucleoside-diphosphate sugar epimerase/dehydratase [Mesoterricola sediminis]BDU75437.1 polysaccharide biosynthesis protein CapD [Mesoterricola sediminis]